MVRGWLGLVALLAGGCLAPGAFQCGDVLCPVGSRCSPRGDRCATQAQLDACTSAQITSCVIEGVNGVCTDGVCVLGFCGNHLLELGEACDDGNHVDGDGCSANCLSNETCGNSIRDTAAGEQCDDGPANADTPGAACRTDCKRARCGDGITDPDEDCDGATSATCGDLHFYGAGTVACTDLCRYDFSACARCGDGVVNGPELCDLTPAAGTCLDFGYDTGVLGGCTVACSPDVSGCRRIGFAPVAAPGTGDSFAAWQAPSGELFAVGAGGRLLRRDASGWASLTSNTSADLWGVWGSSASDVWAVGVGGTIVHWDGTAATVQTPVSNTLRGVSGANRADIWAVGAGGVILHYDGTGWTPNSFAAPGVLSAVWSHGVNDAWTVGQAGVFRWNGVTWSATSVSANNYTAVWGSSSSDVWVGTASQVLYHWNGGSWSSISLPVHIQGLWGSAADDVYAVGTGGGMAHYDGVSWTPLVVDTTAPLYGVTGGGARDVTIVGGFGAVRRSAGWAWSTATVNPAPVAVAGAALDRVVVTGTSLQIFDGATWTSGPALTAPSYAAAVVANNIWVSGANGVTLRFDGIGWLNHDLTSTAVFALRGVTTTNVWAVGDVVAQWNGTVWQSKTTGVSATEGYKAVWASGATDLFFGGGDAGAGLIVHSDGSTFAKVAAPPTAITGLWGSGASDVWAVGLRGAIWRYDGVSWRDAGAGVGSDLTAVSGCAADDVWIVGGGGVILHWNGTQLEPVRPLVTRNFTSVWCHPRAIYIVDGTTALPVLRR